MRKCWREEVWEGLVPQTKDETKIGSTWHCLKNGTQAWGALGSLGSCRPGVSPQNVSSGPMKRVCYSVVSGGRLGLCNAIATLTRGSRGNHSATRTLSLWRRKQRPRTMQWLTQAMCAGSRFECRSLREIQKLVSRSVRDQPSIS